MLDHCVLLHDDVDDRITVRTTPQMVAELREEAERRGHRRRRDKGGLSLVAREALALGLAVLRATEGTRVGHHQPAVTKGNQSRARE